MARTNKKPVKKPTKKEPKPSEAFRKDPPKVETVEEIDEYENEDVVEDVVEKVEDDLEAIARKQREEEDAQLELTKNVSITPEPEKTKEVVAETAIIAETPKDVNGNDEILLWWKKVGGGGFDLERKNGKIEKIKPGQKFQAYDSEVPKGFRDVVICLDSPADQMKKIQIVPVVYTMEPNGDGLFHIIDSKGKRLSEKALDRESALSLINSLQA